MKYRIFLGATIAWIIFIFLCPPIVNAQGRRGSEEARLLRDAAALESRGDYERAEMVLRRLMDIDPASTGGIFALERVFRTQGFPEKILPVLNIFISNNSHPSSSQYIAWSKQNRIPNFLYCQY